MPAIGTIGRLLTVLLAASNQLLLSQQAGDFITDLAGQLFQVDQRAGRRQLLLMLARQGLHQLLHPSL